VCSVCPRAKNLERERKKEKDKNGSALGLQGLGLYSAAGTGSGCPGGAGLTAFSVLLSPVSMPAPVKKAVSKPTKLSPIADKPMTAIIVLIVPDVSTESRNFWASKGCFEAFQPA
jgi:hypothetical protein